jgi:hypothetical protein
MWAAFVAVLLSTIIVSTPRSGAAPATIAVDGIRVPVPADLHNPGDIEQFLGRVEAAQHSTSLAFLTQAPPDLRAAVLATEARPGGVHVESNYGTARSDAQRTRELAEVGSPAAPAGTVCGWAYKHISYTPGLITYYTLWLRTDFCWNGRAIVGTPYQTHGGTAYWGWSYRTNNTILTWYPYPTRYFSGVEAAMTLAGVYHNFPYIYTWLYGVGWVYTWWNSEN